MSDQAGLGGFKLQDALQLLRPFPFLGYPHTRKAGPFRMPTWMLSRRGRHPPGYGKPGLPSPVKSSLGVESMIVPISWKGLLLGAISSCEEVAQFNLGDLSA
jgi:hypothetical protein